MLKELCINQLKIKADKKFDANSLKSALKRATGCDENIFNNPKVIKLSIDSRRKPDIFYVVSASFTVEEKDVKRLLKSNKNIAIYNPVRYSFELPDRSLSSDKDYKRPVVVGMGPAGFVCAYYLSLWGYRPIVLEMGRKVEERIKDVNEFWNGGKILERSNIQFGEGGAGTFSDGKLQTGVKDKYGRIGEILKLFNDNGAPDDILYLSKPHIGTDKLTLMVKNIREKIINMGGEVLFETRFVKPIISNNTLTGIVAEQSGEEKIINTDTLVLATGHSSRNTFRTLFESGLNMDSKPFAVGYRVVHKREIIDNSQYGEDFPEFLPASDYKLTYSTSKDKKVFSFCMCPGGYVVNASSEDGYGVCNGMSNHDRGGEYSNSAIVIGVDKDIFGDGLFDGMRFQEEIEKKTYELGNGLIPVQYYFDFKNRKDNSENPPSVEFNAAFKGGIVKAPVFKILNDELNDAFDEGMRYFGNVIDGFDGDDTIIAGIESRTSSPIKIIRDSETFMSNINGIFPCGEGAGYAGGITSAALDGLKVAEKVALRYN